MSMQHPQGLEEVANKNIITEKKEKDKAGEGLKGGSENLQSGSLP